jgi:sugar phosphate isomerase/epimerase
MAEFRDYLIHFHGKFYSMENGEEPNLDYEGVVRALLDLGYTGWISSEYEGEPTDTLAVVQAQQAMLKRYIKKYAG